MITKNIYLIGFMGCGKSTLAKKMALALGKVYVDMDDVIEAQQGKSISQIFEENGEDYFRGLESKLIEDLKDKKNLVISTGGGAPCFNNNMEAINANGYSIYIKVTPEELLKRLEGEMEKRPLLADKSKEEALEFIASKLESRKEFYEQASLVYDELKANENRLFQHLANLEQ